MTTVLSFAAILIFPAGLFVLANGMAYELSLIHI